MANDITLTTTSGELLTDSNFSKAFRRLHDKGFAEIDASSGLRLRIESDTALALITNPKTDFSEAAVLSYLLDKRVRSEGADDAIIQLVEIAKRKLRERIQRFTTVCNPWSDPKRGGVNGNN